MAWRRTLGSSGVLAVAAILIGSSIVMIAANVYTSRQLGGATIETGSPPELYPQPTVEGNAGNILAITCYVYDPDNDVLNVTWDFGDGTPNATNESGPAGDLPQLIQEHAWNPTPLQGQGDYFVYYTLNITADDGNGNVVTVSVPVSIYVPFNQIPNIALSVSTTLAGVGDIVTIYANASDGEGEPLTWTFVFNDSVDDYLTEVYYTNWTAPDELVYNNITQAFGAPGNYTVTLYVSDALPGHQVFPHNMSQRSQTIRIVENRPPMLSSITFTPSSTVINATIGYIIITFYIDCFDPDGDVLTVGWDFGDGSPGETNVTAGGPLVYDLRQEHNYTHTGYFNVTVNASDGRPGHDIAQHLQLHITSDNLPPMLVSWTTDLGPSGDAEVGQLITFTLVITDPELDPIELVWNFGDGSPLIFVNLTGYVNGNVTSIVQHSFSDPAVYDVVVEFTDNIDGFGYHNVTSTMPINVITDSVPPVADAGLDQIVIPGALVQFNGSGSYDNLGIVTYTWTFIYNRNLVTLTGPEPTFTFVLDGVYNVTLNVTDEAGNFGTDVVMITVEPAIPEFSSLILPTLGMIGLFVAVALWRRIDEL